MCLCMAGFHVVVINPHWLTPTLPHYRYYTLCRLYIQFTEVCNHKRRAVCPYHQVYISVFSNLFTLVHCMFFFSILYQVYHNDQHIPMSTLTIYTAVHNRIIIECENDSMHTVWLLAHTCSMLKPALADALLKRPVTGSLCKAVPA